MPASIDPSPAALTRRPCAARLLATILFAASALIPVLPSQDLVTVPEAFDIVPGNANLAMPLRWGTGVMQTLYGPDAIPDALRGATITAVRVRRPPGEEMWPARTATLGLTLGTTTTLSPTSMTVDTAVNLTTSMDHTLVAGPAAALAMPAFDSTGRDDPLGEQMIELQLSTPFVVPDLPDVRLFVEWSAGDPAGWSAPNTHWVDAVWLTEAEPAGYATAVGMHGCGPMAEEPATLRPAASSPAPEGGESLGLTLTNVGPGVVGVVMFGAFPPGHPAAVVPQVFGGCPLWPDLTLPTVSLALPPNGNFSIAVPDADLTGLEILAQAIGFAPAPNGGLFASNAVGILFDDIGVDEGSFSTVFLPGDGSVPAGSTTSPFPVFRGVAPILEFVVTPAGG